MAGAQQLVGKGDMLFNPMGIAKPIRVQGTFISDSEVHKVIEFVKNQAPETEYASDVIHSIERVQTSAADDDTDELLSDAIETVVRAEQASVSMLQRRFRIGYNRAARLIDMMESRGIIGPADGSRPRRVLMTEDEFLGLSAEADE
jgi:S-DNA-T family DNA segregation ATPase FtsK/SpoIIIE